MCLSSAGPLAGAGLSWGDALAGSLSHRFSLSLSLCSLRVSLFPLSLLMVSAQGVSNRVARLFELVTKTFRPTEVAAAGPAQGLSLELELSGHWPGCRGAGWVGVGGGSPQRKKLHSVNTESE